MIKAQEMVSSLSCLNRAHDDEPIFVLRAKDPLAADVVRIWAMMAHRSPHEIWKVKEARELANQMDFWRNRSAVLSPSRNENATDVTS